jgi:hypothetical protein
MKQSATRQRFTTSRNPIVSDRRTIKAMRIYSISLACLLYAMLKCSVADGFAPPLGLGAVLFQPKGLVTKSSEGNVPALLEASEFFIDAFWVGKVGGGATE